MHTAVNIAESLLSIDLKNLCDMLRRGTCSATDIAAANISLPEKALLAAALAGTTTVRQVRDASVPVALMEAILASPQIVVAGNTAVLRRGALTPTRGLSAVAGTGVVGTVTAA